MALTCTEVKVINTLYLKPERSSRDVCVFRLLLSDFKFIHWLSLHSGTTPNREPYRIPELTESGRPSFPGRMALGGGGRVGAGAWGEPR